MDRFDRELHPIYGAIPRDGEFVERGEILGFSVDMQEVITAPVSGWVRLVSNDSHAERHLRIEIVPAAVPPERPHAPAA